MARLTSDMRRALVNAVLADIPQVAYDEQITAVVQKHVLTTMPPAVRRVYDDSTLREWLRTTREYSYEINSSATVVGIFSWNELPATVIAEVKSLHEARSAQEEAYGEMRAALTAHFNACSTTAVFSKRFPEFVKYLPKIDQPGENLPADANLITNLVKLGWKA